MIKWLSLCRDCPRDSAFCREPRQSWAVSAECENWRASLHPVLLEPSMSVTSPIRKGDERGLYNGVGGGVGDEGRSFVDSNEAHTGS